MKKFYLNNKIPIGSILLFILVWGVLSFQFLQTGLFPDITFPKIKVIAENGQQPVNKMMLTVTIPLENAIKRTQDLELIRSTTSRGSCEISAFLRWDTDIDLGKQRIEAEINSVMPNLPLDVNIKVEKMNPSILPVMGYSLEGEGRSQIELRQIAEYIVKPFLSRVEGVSEIAVIGGKTKEYWVVLEPLKMSQLGITPQSVSTAISQSNFIISNGYTSDYNRLYLNLTNSAISHKEDLENLPIRSNLNRVVYIKDIAKVEVAEKKEYIKINANGKNVPLIAVIKQPNANLVDLTKEVQRKQKELEKILPHGVRLIPFYNQADFVNNSIKSLSDVLWIGLVLAIFVTLLFLRSFKAGSVMLITIPITLSLTLLVIYLVGYTLNIMTIGAIAAAIGLLIDDAIIVVEQIHRTHEEHPEENSFKMVTEAIHYLFPAMVGSSLSTIVIFLPFLLMSGVAGAFFKVMTNTMIITLICSFIVTWLGLPVLYMLFSKGTQKSVKVKVVKQRTWVKFFIMKPIIAILFILILIVSSILILPKLPSGFLPEMDEGSLVLDFKSPPGTSLEETDRMLQKVEEILKNTPEVNKFSRRLGTQMGFFITEPNNGDYLIQLRSKRNKTTMVVADDIRKKIESSLPALTVDFGQVIGDMIGDLMATSKPIEVKIYGDDPEVLKNLAEKTAELIRNVKGTADVFDGIVIAGPEINIEPDVAKLAQYNITPTDFQFQMQNKIEGNVIGSIIELNRLADLRTIEAGHKNLSLNDIKNSQIFLPNGFLKPIGEFAKISLTKGVAEIERENLKTIIAVTGRLNNRDLGSTLKDIQNTLKKNLSLPSGYNIEYGGAYAEQQKAFNELLLILISAVFLLFIVILFLFKKLRISISFIIISVLGISGSFFALWITNTALNVGSYTGIIMIVGIIGENSIFTYLQYIKARENVGRDEAISYSISTRLRPKLMTALGAITALFPLALGIGTGAQMHQPLAIAIIGGMVIALPLLLIVLPTMLRIIEK